MDFRSVPDYAGEEKNMITRDLIKVPVNTP